MTLFGIIILVLLAVRAGVQLWLEWLNQRHVHDHAGAVPEALRGAVDEPTYAQSVQYSLARSRFEQGEILYDFLVLVVVLYSGCLSFLWTWFLEHGGQSIWTAAAWLFAVGVLLTLVSLPLAWYAQFRLEARFGFNTTTLKLWLMDRVKGLALAALLGYPLLALILKLVDWTGDRWWLWAWGCLLVFQIVMSVLAPILILPLFNKLTPLPEGSLRERLLALGQRTGFSARNILVMDGSKRSRHSNAFFTSFGRWRKVVLFDTLVQQLQEKELEAVLAHEIGHYKKGHIPKMLVSSAIMSLAGFLVLFGLTKFGWFYNAFGFEPGYLAPALLLFGLLSGCVTFWLSPLQNCWSRRYEYQADAYAAQAIGENQSLISALRKLSEKNLSNLTPHPWYSGFYYSHPTLLERENRLKP